MAMDRFKNRLGDQATLLKALGKDNPFPFSFEVQVDKPERIKALVSQVEHWPKVETAKFGQEVVEHLFALTRVLRLGGAVLIVFLCLATLFIIINTIRLTVFARRREVVIMKYVGATDWFIRWPFMLEGMTLGLGGGVIACAIVDLIYVSLSGRLHTTFAFFPILQSWPTLLYADLFILACGTLIGALGSYLSLKKFLRV
jgi:cell division transport system permease protein